MRYIHLTLILLLASCLFAEATYVPYTTMAEDFGSNTCAGCAIAWEGLQVPLAQTHNGEFFVAKLYTQSGDLTTPAVLDRFAYYEVLGIPAVIFNGKTRVNGSGDGIADGTQYISALNNYRYSSSPLMMEVTNFLPATGVFSGRVRMVSPTVNIENAQVVYYLLEDNISLNETHVVRSVLYDDFNLSGANATYNFSKTFTVNPAWNTANLWAVASVQLEDKAIVQNVSTLTMPDYNLRVAMDWNQNIVQPPTLTTYLSQPFWIFNQGLRDDFTTQIVVDSAPNDWYFNYCDEDNNCYVGNMEVPWSLGDGETKAFHLNIMLNSPGMAHFRFVITSNHIGTYSVPFTYATEGSAVNDEILVNQALRMGSIYPNPVKQQAELELNSDKAFASVAIDIFNLKGQKVQSIPVDNISQGTNRINFTPDSELPNGVYFYRLQGSANPAQKFILMK